MADISKEIKDFAEAEYGEEVRGSMISLAEKVNAEGEKALSDVASQVEVIQGAVADVNNSVTIAREAVERANDTMDHADDILLDATTQAEQAADSAVLSQSWSEGGTGTRQGEDTNNSKYHSQQSKNQADKSKQEADRAVTEADRAAQYANIVAPGFYVDPGTMTLYMKAGIGVDFKVFENVLYWKIA